MAFSEALSEIRKVADTFRADASVAWFRGHADKDWLLNSSLHRYVDRFTKHFKKQPDLQAKQQLLRDEYKTLYRRFKADAWPLLEDIERSEWGIIFSMQHHGLPTRLLDWSENLAAGLFFAQFNRDPAKDALLWVLDPQALNQGSIGQTGLVALDDDTGESNVDVRNWHPRWIAPKDPLSSIAVSPIFTNRRMVAQRSAFTVSGDSFDPLDVEFPSLAKTGKLIKFPIPAALSDEVDDFLANAGFTPFTIYPDLHGLALRQEFEAEKRIKDAKRWYPQFFK